MTGRILLMVGVVYVYLGYFSGIEVDNGTLGIGLAMLNTGLLTLRRYLAGTILLIIIFVVLAAARIISSSADYSIWFFMKFLLGAMITSSIVWLQFRYHKENKMAEQGVAGNPLGAAESEI